MTITTILPSIGPSPPEFKRPIVPEGLRPKLVGQSQNSLGLEKPFVPAAKSSVEPNPAVDTFLQQTAQSSDESVRGLSQITSNLAGPSAVAVQVQESSVRAGSLNVSDQKLRGELSDEEEAAVASLKERDREVRSHEAAHASVGGGYTGTPSYEFVRGPDGVQYAVGGHVDIDVSEVPNDPEATIAKMEVVKNAALAPAQPSGQDRTVAAAAESAIREAQAEVSRLKQEARVDEPSQDAPVTNVALEVSVQVAEQQANSSMDDHGQFNNVVPAGINLLV